MDILNRLREKVGGLGESFKTDKSRNVNEEEAKEDLEPVCLLFPSYARRNEKDEWEIRIRGWAFCAPKKSRTRNLFLGLTSLALQKDDERFQFLESRTSWFWTNNISQGDFLVQIDGLTDSNKMSIEGDPNDETGPITTTVEPHGEGATTTTANITVPDVKKVLDQAGKMITGQIHADSEMIRANFTPKSGHFLGDLSIPHQTITKWIGEENQDTVVSGLIGNIVGSKDKNRVRLLKLKVYKDGSDPHYGVINLVEPKGVSVISDIDDTIKDTDILQGARKVLSRTFLQPFKEVTGMPELYRKFYEKGASIHYVSNSPWQLFPSLRSFFHTYNFPPGSAHFKFYDGLIKSAYEQKENPMASKFMYIRELLKDFPERKFILIGDTGELDPEIYTTIARENPGRILRIYVRDVTTEHVKDLPAEKPKHSYTKTFVSIYGYLRTYYDEEEEKDTPEVKEEEGNKAKDAAADVITQQAAAATSGETTETITDPTDPHKPERKLTNRLMDKLHLDMSYLYGTALTDSPESIDDDSSNTNKPKAPLKLLSPSKLSKLRSYSLKSKSKDEKDKDSPLEEDDDKGELKTPLEMFHERLKLLQEGLPADLFHTFTNVTELENDPAIKAELQY